MPFERIRRVVRGAKGKDVRLFDQRLRTEIAGRDHGLCLVPNLLCRGGRQGLGDAEIPLQLKMAPMIQGVADGERERFCKRAKLVKRVAVAGDEPFLHPGAAHGAPFVVVAGQPKLVQIVCRFVFKDFLRAQMAVPVKDRLGFGDGVKQRFGRFRAQQKVGCHKGLHLCHLFFNM